MGFGFEVHGRMRVAQVALVGRAAQLVVTALLLVAVFGCGKHRDEHKPASTERSGDSTAAAGARVTGGTQTGASHQSASHQGAKSTGPANVVRLTQKGCVAFEPHWTSLGVGQSLTWHSDLKSPVTIHVSPGAFDKTEYVVRAGGSVTTGPARSPGSYSISTEPAACQSAPRGVRGSGPGVTVIGAVQH